MVATPIGNLKDITFRAVEVLRSVDVIACEDTRHTGKLLKALEIEGKLVSYHEHNETERAAEFAKNLTEGKNIAIVSDAGTPGINDPGFRIVQTALDVGANVVPIPGAVAFVNAVIASGLPTDSIFFGGFLPSKSGDRKKRLSEVSGVAATLVFYETPHRLSRALADCLTELGDRKACVARELTKLHEEFVPGTLSELNERYADSDVKGEIVLVIDREGELVPLNSNMNLRQRVDELIAEGQDHRAALKKAAKEFGIPKSEAYRTLQQENKS